MRPCVTAARNSPTTSGNSSTTIGKRRWVLGEFPRACARCPTTLGAFPSACATYPTACGKWRWVTGNNPSAFAAFPSASGNFRTACGAWRRGIGRKQWAIERRSPSGRRVLEARDHCGGVGGDPGRVKDRFRFRHASRKPRSCHLPVRCKPDKHRRGSPQRSACYRVQELPRSDKPSGPDLAWSCDLYRGPSLSEKEARSARFRASMDTGLDKPERRCGI